MKVLSAKKVAELYKQRVRLTKEITYLEVKLQEIRQKRQEQDAKLAKYFEKHNNELTLPDGTLVRRHVVEVPEKLITADMVGSVYRSGYSYPKYKEIPCMTNGRKE